MFLSFLPLSHSYEHTCGQFFPIATGAQIYYAESVDKLVANISEVNRPSCRLAGLYEAIRARILRGVETAGVQGGYVPKSRGAGLEHYRDPSALSLSEQFRTRCWSGW